MKQSSVNKDHQKLIKEIEALSESNQKILKKLLFIQVFGFLRLLVVLTPLVLAAIYLPPFLIDWWEIWQPTVDRFVNTFLLVK